MTGEHLSYEQRIQRLEAIEDRCGNELTDARYASCMKRTEGTRRNYLQHLCPHPGGYTFRGEREPCPAPQ